MPEQFSLPGLEAEPQSSDTVFFAINPDPDTATRIAQVGVRLRDAHGLKGKLLETSHFHVTLLFVGLYAATRVDVAKRSAETVVIAPFDVVFDRVLSFPGSRAFVLGSDGDSNVALAALRQRLDVGMRKLGLRAKPIHTPHLTLLYGDRIVTEQVIEPIRWTVKEFVLIRSHVGKSLHEPLGRWSLTG